MNRENAEIPSAVRRANPVHSSVVARAINGAGHLSWGLRTSLSYKPLVLLSLAVILVGRCRTQHGGGREKGPQTHDGPHGRFVLFFGKEPGRGIAAAVGIVI